MSHVSCIVFNVFFFFFGKAGILVEMIETTHNGHAAEIVHTAVLSQLDGIIAMGVCKYQNMYKQK